MYEELVRRLRTRNGWALNETLDEAADALENLVNQNDAAYAKGWENGEAAAESRMPKWIPVTERLPEKDVPVFVYLFSDSPYIAWINREGEWETEEFTIDHDYLPKAWLPLPQPPKEEAE